MPALRMYAFEGEADMAGPDNRRTRRYITERFLERFGKLPVATVERRHVEKILAEEKPGQKKLSSPCFGHW